MRMLLAKHVLDRQLRYARPLCGRDRVISAAAISTTG